MFSFYFKAIAADTKGVENGETQSAANEATSNARTLDTNQNSSPKAVELVSSDDSDESFSEEDDDDRDFIVSGDEDAESEESEEDAEDCPKILPVKVNTT